MTDLEKLKKIMNNPFVGRLINENRTPIDLNTINPERIRILLDCLLNIGSEATIKIIKEL